MSGEAAPITVSISWVGDGGWGDNRAIRGAGQSGPGGESDAGGCVCVSV